MHVTVDNPNAMIAAEKVKNAEAQKRNDLQMLAKKVLTKPLPHGELVKAIMAEIDCKESTAKNRIKDMSGELKIVEKNEEGLYRLVAVLDEVKGQEGQN